MLIEEIREPTAIVLRYEGSEIGRKPYDGGLPAVWTAFTSNFDEVVVEAADGEHVFEIPGGLPFIGTGGDVDIPGYADPNDPWSSTIELVPKT